MSRRGSGDVAQTLTTASPASSRGSRKRGWRRDGSGSRVSRETTRRLSSIAP